MRFHVDTGCVFVISAFRGPEYTAGPPLITNTKMKSNHGNQLCALRPHGHLAHKRRLQAHGWSYRRACVYLDISLTQLSEVINGRRPSKRLLARIWNLPRLTDGGTNRKETSR